MLVRARRLVFDDSLVGSSFRRCVTGLGDYSVSRLIGSVLWAAKRNGNHICEPLPTERTAIEACQADFNARWLAETEVMPLEWQEDGESIRSGLFEVYSHHNGYWSAVYDSVVLGNYVVTKAGAMQLCEAHHRKIVLGE